MTEGESEKQRIPLTIILVGASSVGKTCLANQLVNKCFDESVESTSGTDLFRYTMEFDKYTVDLTLKDTCGQEQYRSLVAQFYRDTQGALIVYDITNRESFEYLQEWISEVSQFCPQGVKVIIVGNKSDLEMEAREVDTSEGKKYAEGKGYEFFETSAKHNVKVELAFRGLVENILQSHNIEEFIKPSSEPTITLERPQNTPEEVVEKKEKNCC